MKKYLYLIISIILIISITSCGKKEKEQAPEYVRPDVFEGYDESTIVFKADGSILEIAMQDYNQSDVDYSGLKSYVESEIKATNSKLGSENISMTDYFDDSGIIKAAIHYTDLNSYNAFNCSAYEMAAYDPDKVNIRVPSIDAPPASLTDAEGASVSDALIDEYTDVYEATFTDAKDGSVKRSSEISKSYMMLTVDDKVDVSFEDGKVLYYNSYATKGKKDNTVKCSGEGKAIIVFEFNYAY